jgi:hypothetical protein
MIMAEPVARSSIRLAELLAVLSLATDLGMGQPMEHVLRQCLIPCGWPSGWAWMRLTVWSSTTQA